MATTSGKPAALPQFYRRKLPESCISFSSPEGRKIFAEALASGHMNCYFGLAAQFRTQEEPAYCGLSTLVMALNTLEVDPHKVWKGPWRWYHESMLDCCVPLSYIEQNGITVEQFECLAICNTLTVHMVRADRNLCEQKFRQAVKNLTQVSEGEVLIVSYSRAVLDQTGDGHFSPIGGYHPERDLVLILDTARFKYPPHWVPVPLLWKAMLAHDKVTDKPRGYYTLRKSDIAPLLIFRISDNLSTSLPAFSNMKEFLKQWNLWLNVEGKNGDVEERMLQVEAVEALFGALATLPEDHNVLTTQIDVHCPDSLTPEHLCVSRNLVQSLEELDIFRLIQQKIAKAETSAVKKAGLVARSPDLPSPDGNGTSSHLGKMDRGVGSIQCDKCKSPFSLEEAHFVTMLLLSWPYKTSIQEYNGSLIKKVLDVQVSGGSQALRNEVFQLKKQFTSLLGYLRCHHCQCKSTLKL